MSFHTLFFFKKKQKNQNFEVHHTRHTKSFFSNRGMGEMRGCGDSGVFWVWGFRVKFFLKKLEQFFWGKYRKAKKIFF